MATSVVEIGNRALARIGIDQLIESLDDPNNRARQVRLAYEPCRDEVLEDFPFNFAQAVVALAPVSNCVVPGWSYCYRYPANCAKVHAITDEGGVRSARPHWPRADIWHYPSFLGSRAEFRVMADPVTEGARLLVTDSPQAWAWYTVKITDPAQFTALFRSALAWRMAMDLALALRADSGLFERAQQQYYLIGSKAEAHSLNEQRPDRMPGYPSIAARF